MIRRPMTRYGCVTLALSVIAAAALLALWLAPPAASRSLAVPLANGGETPAAHSLITGRANYATCCGSRYLAMRLDRGTLVRITGAGGSWTTRTTDYGPAKRTGDIADIALGRFAEVCGWSVAHARRMGECDVTVELLGEIELPETDTAPGVELHGQEGTE